MPTPIVAANWKMNKTFDEGRELFEKIRSALHRKEGADVVIIPTFLHLRPIAEQLLGQSRIQLGAQNCYYEVEGAYTGEISPRQLQDLGVDYVLVGHSERRAYFREDSELLTKKLLSVLRQDMQPIFCCGEPLSVREKGDHISYVCKQLREVLQNIEVKDYLETDNERIVIAYEPVWAIGTGRTATPKEIQEMHAALRLALCELSGLLDGKKIPILYGGSVKPENAAVLSACPDIDGALVGGASLKALDFLKIVDAFS